jgi:DNA-binding transcriptional LysR family regulator
VALAIDNSARIVEALLAQDVSSALIEGPCAHPDIVMERFAPDELVIVCHPEHRWAGRQDVPPAELADERFILREAGSGTRDIIEEVLGRHGIRLLTDMELGHTEAIKTAVEAGLGVSILSRVACERGIRAGVMAEARIAGIRVDRWFHHIRLTGRRIPPIFKAFLDFLQSPAAR